MQTKPREAFVDLYYEDVVVGDVVMTDEHTFTAQAILDFADVTRDRHPLHTDEAYCRNTQFGAPIVHGLFGLSIIEGLKSELKLYQTTSVASLGWDNVRFKKAILAGDTVHVRVEFISKRECRNPNHGIIVERTDLFNQHGETVIEAEHVSLLFRKSARSASA